jgi:hypothetical protein
VSGAGDHVPEMPPAPLLDDPMIDALVDGDPVPPGLDHLAAFTTVVRSVGDRPAPRPSPELAAFIARGAASPAPGRATRAVPPHTGRQPTRPRAARLRLVAKVGFVSSAVAVSVAGAAAAGVLPGGADSAVRRAIELVTPVELTDSDDHQDNRDIGRSDRSGADQPTDVTGDAQVPSLPGEHGDRVSADATGESDGEPGVDGPTVADEAPGAAHRPAAPPGDTAVTPQAGDEPATSGGPPDTPATVPEATPPAPAADGAPSPAS